MSQICYWKMLKNVWDGCRVSTHSLCQNWSRQGLMWWCTDSTGSPYRFRFMFCLFHFWPSSPLVAWENSGEWPKALGCCTYLNGRPRESSDHRDQLGSEPVNGSTSLFSLSLTLSSKKKKINKYFTWSRSSLRIVKIIITRVKTHLEKRTYLI